MSNDEQIAELRKEHIAWLRKVPAWNAWRQYSSIRPNLSEADLLKANLRGANLNPPWGQPQRGGPQRGGPQRGGPQQSVPIAAQKGPGQGSPAMYSARRNSSLTGLAHDADEGVGCFFSPSGMIVTQLAAYHSGHSPV
jgi:hypothetical protein